MFAWSSDRVFHGQPRRIGGALGALDDAGDHFGFGALDRVSAGVDRETRRDRWRIPVQVRQISPALQLDDGQVRTLGNAEDIGSLLRQLVADPDRDGVSAGHDVAVRDDEAARVHEEPRPMADVFGPGAGWRSEMPARLDADHGAGERIDRSNEKWVCGLPHSRRLGARWLGRHSRNRRRHPRNRRRRLRRCTRRTDLRPDRRDPDQESSEGGSHTGPLRTAGRRSRSSPSCHGTDPPLVGERC